MQAQAALEPVGVGLEVEEGATLRAAAATALLFAQQTDGAVDVNFLLDEGFDVFTGRVVICSSQAPQFENAGSGMARRALILETQQPAQKSDADLDQKLAGELGAIVS